MNDYSETVRSDVQKVEGNLNSLNGNCNQMDKYVKLRKMLSTAALSVALISWYTTANGLHHYVFSSIWQAYIISAALQGALFSLSIMGIKLFMEFNVIKRMGLVFVWGCLLVASSIFSYVYISKDVYSDKLLQEDAHRILSTYCLTKNYALNDAADELLDGKEEENSGIISKMNMYVNSLATLENGIDLSEEHNDELLENIKKDLLPYAYKYKASNNIDDINDIENCVDTSYLIEYLNTILSGKYTNQDIDDTKSEIRNLITSIEEEKENKEKQMEAKVRERDEYQERLASFRDVSHQKHDELEQSLQGALDQIITLEDTISSLGAELTNINRTQDALDSVEGSMASNLYSRVLQIRSVMNADKIQVDEVQRNAEEIYNILLENSVFLTERDSRVDGYSNFRNNIRKYADVMEAKEIIDSNIESLYNLPSVSDLTIKYSENTSEENINNDFDNSNKDTDAAWISYWQEHLNSLKNSAQKLQAGGMDTDEINDLIEAIENRERLYLSDLNDFERAWALLFGIHTYKTLLKFSFVFAFGIDLFSVLMSCLLYLFRPQKQ